ncbi:MAG: thiolase family protein [Pseudomonadota bacterium]|nr:thiolase family protein [Pseudomonadota bacterium]
MPRHSAVITGAAGTGMGAFAQSTCLGLQLDAARRAAADAGVRLSDVDGVICAYSLVQPHLMLASCFAEFAGLNPSACFAIQAGGATGAVMTAVAASLVESGAYRNVLVVTGDNRLSGLSRDGAVAALAEVGHPEFERPYGFSVPAGYALVAARYMHEYGVTAEDLAHIAVAMRRHASRTEGAHMRNPVTLEEVQASRVIAAPLRLLDCSLISDGAAALIISRDDVAADLPGSAVKVLSSGQAHTHEHIVAAPSLVEFGCKESSRQAFERAGVSAKDIDIVQIYDSFTITLLVELESIGFFERGAAGPAIAGGALDLDGALPCNTHGGLLSHGHSGAAGGMYHIVEAVTQLRGAAGARQAGSPKLAFVHGDGGILSAHCSLILARD